MNLNQRTSTPGKKESKKREGNGAGARVMERRRNQLDYIEENRLGLTWGFGSWPKD